MRVAPIAVTGRQVKRARQKIKEVRNYPGQIIRNIETAVAQGQVISLTLEAALGKAQIVFNQTLNRKAKEKLCSWHAPDLA